MRPVAVATAVSAHSSRTAPTAGRRDARRTSAVTATMVAQTVATKTFRVSSKTSVGGDVRSRRRRMMSVAAAKTTADATTGRPPPARETAAADAAVTAATSTAARTIVHRSAY